MNRFAITIFCSIILAGLSGCATKPKPPPGNHVLQPGFYILECDAFYESGLVHVSPTPDGWHVNVLEAFRGQFDLQLGSKPNTVSLERADIDYFELKRSLKGWAYIYPDNKLAGEATVWIKKTRHHRADRPLLMRPATTSEFERVKRRLIAREEWPFGDVRVDGTQIQN